MDNQKTAIVTGAASGIGRSTALRLHRDGVDVLAVDRDKGGLARLDGPRTLAVDLSSPRAATK